MSTESPSPNSPPSSATPPPAANSPPPAATASPPAANSPPPASTAPPPAVTASPPASNSPPPNPIRASPPQQASLPPDPPIAPPPQPTFPQPDPPTTPPPQPSPTPPEPPPTSSPPPTPATALPPVASPPPPTPVPPLPPPRTVPPPISSVPPRPSPAIPPPQPFTPPPILSPPPVSNNPPPPLSSIDPPSPPVLPRTPPPSQPQPPENPPPPPRPQPPPDGSPPQSQPLPPHSPTPPTHSPPPPLANPPRDPPPLPPILPSPNPAPPSFPATPPQRVSPPPPPLPSVPSPPLPPVPLLPSVPPQPLPSLPPAGNTGGNETTSGTPGSSPSAGGNGGIGTGGTVAIVVAVSLVLLGICGILAFCLWKRKKREARQSNSHVLPTSIDPPQSDSKFLKVQLSLPSNASNSGGLGNSRSWFTYQELDEATSGFSAQNLLGEGGFGSVYKGNLVDGREVAVKRLKIGGGQGEREFRSEVEIISRIHHRHLVSLVGYCISEDKRLLVYEYVPNNTLYFHLHGLGRPVMDWATRVKIAIGAARGIAYLHEDCHPRIIHRDIKSSNILLDGKFEARVSDFGLAKLAMDANTHISTRVMGTFGYMAPEYASSGKLTDKSDVYSYGVVLLELITGRKPVDSSQPLGEESLVEWARPLLSHILETQKFEEIADSKLEGNYVDEEMFRLIEAAAACVRHSSTNRPKMGQVVRAFENMAASDLTNGIRVGESEIFNSAQQSAEIQLFQRMAFGSQEYSTDFFSHTQSSAGSEAYRTGQQNSLRDLSC